MPDISSHPSVWSSILHVPAPRPCQGLEEESPHRCHVRHFRHWQFSDLPGWSYFSRIEYWEDISSWAGSQCSSGEFFFRCSVWPLMPSSTSRERLWLWRDHSGRRRRRLSWNRMRHKNTNIYKKLYKRFSLSQMTSVAEVVGVSGETPMAKLLQEWGEILDIKWNYSTKDLFRYLCRVQMYLLNFWEIVQFWPVKPRHYNKGEGKLTNTKLYIQYFSISVSTHHPVETGWRTNPPHHHGQNQSSYIWLLTVHYKLLHLTQ